MRLTHKFNIFTSVIVILSMLIPAYPTTAKNLSTAAATSLAAAVSKPLNPKQSFYGSGWGNVVQRPALPVKNLGDELASLTPAPHERPIKLDLDVEPAIYIPGVPLTIRWTINNFDNVDLNANPRLVIVAQRGVTPQDPDLAKQLNISYSLSIPITHESGSIVWVVDSTAEMPVNIQFELMVGDQDVYDNAVMVDAPQFDVRDGQTSKFSSLSNIQKPANAPEKSLVKITAPADAGDEEMFFSIHAPSQHKLPYMSLSGNPVEILAVGKSNYKNIKKFHKPITIQLKYDPTEHPSWNEDDLQLYYYDDSTFDWYPTITTVDKTNKTLTTQSDHLTVFDYKATSWQGYVPPTVDDFKTSLFTGAATFNMSFWVPPAPGGLTPKLNLTYNSQIMDETPALGQSSWVGSGWNLDTGAIQRNMHGTNSDTSDDTFSIMADGVTGPLLPVSVVGAVTTYNTANQDFTKVTFDSSSNIWNAYSKNGTTYTFGGTAAGSIANLYKDGACGAPNLTWRWSLASQTDINGKKLTYTYAKDLKTACASGQQSDIAVFPDTITYSNSQYRIYFFTESRTDYQTSWTTNTSLTLYGTKRLQRIQIQMLNSGVWNTIRQYVFSYRTVVTGDINDPIYPSSPYSNGGLSLTLGGVQEYGNDGIATLPATSFYYTDKMHLGRVSNGQGGQVDITYDRVTFFDDINKAQRSISANYNSGSGQNCNTAEWSSVLGIMRCDATNYLQVGDIAASGKADRTIPEYMIKPGARYRLRINVRPIDSTKSTSLNYGLIDENTNSTAYYSNNAVTTATGVQELSVEMASSYKATQTRLRLECMNYGCFMREFALVEFLTYYRAVSRTVTDNVTVKSGTYTYHYDEEAPNSSAVSEAIAANGTVYNTALSEFRGHAMSEAVDPQGLATMTFYYQNDTLKGMPYRSLVLNQTFFDDLNGGPGINTSYWSSAGNVSLSAVDNISNATAKLTSATTTNASLARTATINGSMAFAQMRINSSDTNTQGELGLVSTGGKFFGIIAKPTTGGIGVFVRTNTGGGLQDSSTALIPGGTFRYNTWYGVLLIIDPANGFRIRIWQVGDLNNASYESVVSGYPADTWKLRAQANSGTLWFDTPAEGTLFNESTTRYNVTTLTPHGALAIASLQQYTDLNVIWTTQSETISRTYDGKSAWFGTRNTFDYNIADQNSGQYGNLTRTVASSWNGATWVDDHASKTEYFPLNSGVNYLVNLPARSLTLSCNGTAGDGSDCDFSGASGLLGETLYIYNTRGIYNTTPEMGLLIKQRVRLDDSSGISVKYSETGYGYDIWGNQTSVTNYSGYATATTSPTSAALTTTRVYDPTYSTYLVSETNPLNQTVTTSYDFTLGVATSVTDANSVTTTAGYDTFGRMTSIVAPGDSLTSKTLSIAYNNFSPSVSPYNVVLYQRIDANNVVQTVRYYSGLGQLIQTQTLNANVSGVSNNIVQDSQYDILGRLIKQTKPYTYTTAVAFQTQTFTQPLTTTSYDFFGRVTQMLDANSTHVDTSYTGLTTIQTDARGNSTTRVSDIWGRVVSVTPPTASATSYGYDKAGRLTSVALGGTTLTSAMGYDRGGRKISSTDPDMGAWSYAYDALGNLIRQTDAKGQTTCLYYDPIARPKGKTHRVDTNCPEIDPGYGAYAIKYYYDEGGAPAYALGRRTRMEDASGTTTWSYKPRGLVGNETRMVNGAGTYSTSYDYNDADQPTTMTYPDGEQISLGYNSQDALATISNDTGFAYLKNLLYDSAGRPATIQLGSDGTNPILTQQYTYYPWPTARLGGRLNSLTTTNSTNPPLQNLVYSDYDNNGNLLQNSDQVNVSGVFYTDTSTFAYDVLNRLTASSVARGGTTLYNEGFTFDSAGRLNSKTLNGTTTNPTYSSSHPHAVEIYGSNTYTYDANGSQNGRTVNGQGSTLVYDEENHLTSVSGAASASYLYDGDGKLVKSVSAASTTIYIGGYFEAIIPAATPTPTATATMTPTVTATITPTATMTSTATATSTATMMPTATATPTATTTPTATATPTATMMPTATATPIATMTQTATATPTATATAAATETATPTVTPVSPTATPSATQSSGFPLTGVLDDFNRADGPVGSNWQGQGNGYSISGQKISVNDGGDLYWSPAAFGANQEVYATFGTINGASQEIGLVLKSQSNTGYADGLLEVLYNPSAGKVQVWSFTTAQSWWQRGSDIAATFASGDRFGASATAGGQVKVYKNNTLLATVDVTGWPYYASGGYIGMWMTGPAGTQLDDFGGGTAPATFRPGPAMAMSGGGKALAAPVPAQKRSITPPPAGQVWRNYILVAGRRVAVRENTATYSVVHFLLSDHLGSTTITTDAAGALTSQLRYSAYGEVRFASGDTPTNYRYTGQLSQMETLGLYYYGARWYDPYITQMTQPDSIIPDPYNPLDWNRYAYARYNPIRYTDPTGHSADCGIGDPGCHAGKLPAKQLIMERNQWLYLQAKGGKVKDLEALAQLSDYAASLTPDCVSCFVNNMGAVLTGDDQGAAWVNEVLVQLRKATHSEYYDPDNALGQSGFAKIFQDPQVGPGQGGNQPHHFWFYVQVAYQQSQMRQQPATLFTILADISHETFLSNGPGGKSFQDMALGVEGANLGASLYAGTVNPSEVGNYIRSSLSPNSDASRFWSSTLFWYYAFMSQALAVP